MVRWSSQSDAVGCGAVGDGGAVTAALDRWAPSWLLQMPALVDAARAEALARRVRSANRDRLLRERGEALEALAAHETLVLVVEDLHWSDFASVDVLAYLAQRVPPARLLVVGSYRPADLALRDRPLQGIAQGLVAHRRATDIPLARLTRRDVDTCLARRLASPIDGDLGSSLHARTGGNPLFLSRHRRLPARAGPPRRAARSLAPGRALRRNRARGTVRVARRRHPSVRGRLRPAGSMPGARAAPRPLMVTTHHANTTSAEVRAGSRSLRPRACGFR